MITVANRIYVKPDMPKHFGEIQGAPGLVDKIPAYFQPSPSPVTRATLTCFHTLGEP